MSQVVMRCESCRADVIPCITIIIKKNTLFIDLQKTDLMCDIIVGKLLRIKHIFSCISVANVIQNSCRGTIASFQTADPYSELQIAEYTTQWTIGSP